MALQLQWPIKFQNTETLPVIKPETKRPSYVEIGAPGQNIVGGILRDTDYNLDLQPPAIYDTYDRMRKSDGQIGALLNAIKLPILNLDWRIQPASDDEADVAIANWANNHLHNGMTTSLQQLMSNLLLYLDYGSMPFEKVWELDADNHIVPRKLAPRIPKTITYWKVDETGGLAGITQLAYKASVITNVEIPGDKLLVFVNDQEGSDWRGNSILRRCYKHWYIKDKLLIIDAIAKERRAVGIDVGTLKGNDIDSSDQTDLELALMGLHAHEKQFFIEQEERYTYRIEGLQGRPLNVLDSVEYHDKLILRSFLAEFVATAGAGSYAMSRDKSSFFTMALNGIATTIADAFNTYFIKQWLGYNWAMTKYPTLVHSRIETRDVQALSTAIQNLQQTGFINPTSADEEAMRDALELPQVKREKDVSGIALNGAQLASVTTLFQRVGEGYITMDTARAILEASFPFLSADIIDAMTTRKPVPNNAV